MNLIIPPEPKTVIPAIIGITASQIIHATHPEKRDDFKAVVKSLRLRWSWDAYWWQRRIGDLAGDPRDRAAELGHRLLAGGFPVEFPDEATRDLALSAAYEPECRRWILVGNGQYDDWFRIWWGRTAGEYDFYDLARAISGSRYDGVTKSVVAPSATFDQVLDFAQRHDFHVSDKAQALVQRARFAQRQALVAEIKPIRQVDAPVIGRAHLSAGAFEALPRFYDVATSDFCLKTALLPHQQPAVARLAPMVIGAMFMDMGTGKTRCAIDLAHLRRHRMSRVVWFCPVSLKTTIAREWHKHTDLDASDVYVFDDDTNMRDPPTAFVNIVGIESLSSSDRVTLTANALIDEHTFVVLDESSYIKTHDAIRTLRATYLADRARYRLILTGTPISQGVEDLYSQMRFLSPEILGYSSFYSFQANHLEYSEKYPGLVVRAHNVPWLTSKIAPYIYQITKEDAGLNLPAKLYDRQYYQLTGQQWKLYEQAKNEILLSVPEDEIDSYVIFKLFNALQQIVSGFWKRDDGRVIEIEHNRLRQLLDSIAGLPDGEKVIVWCKFVRSVEQVAAALREQYGQDAVALFYGVLNEQERNQELERFRAGARFLVATMATGGHGLDLTCAAYEVFYENSFKYAGRVQAEDRIHRIGQTRRPTYLDLYADCGIERRIERALERKEDVVKSFRREVNKLKTAELKNIARTL